MSNIKGTIVILKDFLFDVETSIKTEYKGESIPTLTFKKGRAFIVPNYQREIRWEKETLFSLMNDIFHGGKFLGNIILSSCGETDYEIIDGQQRLVSLNMLINYIKQNYPDQSTDVGEMVPIRLNCFEKYEQFQQAKYSLSALSIDEQKEIKESDKLQQAKSLEMLYNSISESEIVNTPDKARTFFDNLRKCSLNVIVSNDDDRKISTEYYIDVNLKGIKLDNEDIFKGYLFSQDSSDTIRNLWVSLKQSWLQFSCTCNGNKDQSIYPLMKLLEHYIYCFLLSKDEYRDIEINENLNLESICEVNSTRYYAGDHVIKAINNNNLMQQVIRGTTEYISILNDVVGTDGVPSSMKELLSQLDNTEQKVICNIIKKTVLDKTLLLPKLLILKYYINICKKTVSKQKCREIYAIYFYNVMFMLFGNKKSDAIVMKRLARIIDYFPELIKAINEYFNAQKVIDSKMTAIARWNSNYDAEELQYKCKSLATIYNYFHLNAHSVSITSCDEINNFLSNSDEFSVEHFLINKSGAVNYIDNGDEYKLPGNLKSYGSYIFNFIFVPKSMNRDTLKNYSIQKKLSLLQKGENLSSIKCEYSQMIISEAKDKFKETVTVTNMNSSDIVNLEKYWLVTFKNEYKLFVSGVIENLVDHFSNK